jgi:hypothetical protein
MKSQIIAGVLALTPFVAAIARPEITAAARIAKRDLWVRQVLSSYTSSIDAEATATATATETAASTPQGAISTTILGPSIPALPPGPNASSYPRDGQLHGAQPAPYTPSGGQGMNGSAPVYVPQTDFDFQSLVCTWFILIIENNSTNNSRQLVYTKSTLSLTCSSMHFDASA